MHLSSLSLCGWNLFGRFSLSVNFRYRRGDIHIMDPLTVTFFFFVLPIFIIFLSLKVRKRREVRGVHTGENATFAVAECLIHLSSHETSVRLSKDLLMLKSLNRLLLSNVEIEIRLLKMWISIFSVFSLVLPSGWMLYSFIYVILIIFTIACFLIIMILWDRPASNNCA